MFFWDFPKTCLDFFSGFFGPPGARNGPKMWPKRPAFEPQSIVQIRPMATRLEAKLRFEKIARANYFGSQLFKPEGIITCVSLSKTKKAIQGGCKNYDFPKTYLGHQSNRHWPDLDDTSAFENWSPGAHVGPTRDPWGAQKSPEKIKHV